MISTYVGALMIAGAFSFMPGRIMHDFAVGLSAMAGRSGSALLADTPTLLWPLLAGLVLARPVAQPGPYLRPLTEPQGECALQCEMAFQRPMN